MESTSSSRKSSATEKPSLAANPYNPNSAAYLAYPVKHVMSSLYRRMTEPPDQPVNRLLDAPTIPNARSNSLTPPGRRGSPFQPPPLSPLTLETPHLSDEQADDLLLTRSLAEEIRLLVPARLQLLTSWRLAYSLSLDGSSLATVYKHCADVSGSLGASQRAGYILVIRDASPSADNGSIFGAYLTDAPKPSQHYYGTGECFLWKASILPTLRNMSTAAPNGARSSGRNNNKSDMMTADLLELAGLPPPPSADTTNAQRMTTVRGERRSSSASHSSKPTSPIANPNLRLPSPIPSGASTPDRIRFKAFPYSGLNDFMIYCQSDFLSVGGGDGHYGLWLDDQLENGVSESCPTFGNEGLSDEGKNFDVMGVEVWYVGA